MAKRPTLSDIANINTAAPVINDNNDKIETAFDNTLSRDGSTPNSMESDIDLNGNDLINVGLIAANDFTLGGTNLTTSINTSVNNAAQSASDAADDATAAAQSASSATTSAAEAALYDGPKVDTFADLASVTPAILAVGEYIRCIENGQAYERVSSGGHLDYTGAGGVLLEVLPASDGAYHTSALGAPSGTDDTAGLAALLASAENGKLVFDYHVAPYISGNLLPGENTHIVLMPGVVLEGLSTSSRCFQIQRPHVILEGYGATIKRNVSQSSHIIYISASSINPGKNIRVRGLTIIGNGSLGTGGTGENDCVYIGGAPGDITYEAIPEDVIVEDCVMISPRRNVVSIVAGENITIRNNVLDGTDAVVLRCGVDVEANRYMLDGTPAVRRIKVHNNIVRNCQGINLLHAFADDVEFIGNDVVISDTTASAIGGGSGGAQFNDNVYREGDRLGITAFDAGTGNITVRLGGDQSLHDLDIHRGMWVQGVIKIGSGAAFPSGMVPSYRYCISWISADGTQIRLSVSDSRGEITSFGGAHTGTLDNDPTVSDLQFYVWRPGQSSNCRAIRNRITYTGPAAAVDAFNIATCYNWFLEDNYIDMGLSTGSQVRAAYGYGLTIRGGEGYGGGKGVACTTMSKVSVVDYTAHKTTAGAFVLSGRFLVDRCTAIACTGNVLEATNANGAVIRRLKVWQGAAPATYGIEVGTSDGVLIEDCDVAEAGASPTDSVKLLGTATNTSVLNTRVQGGGIFGTGEITYDPPSLADGAGVTVNVTAPGARFGMFAQASFGLQLQGITMTAYVIASNLISVRFQNETGSTIDLASSTLRVAAR